MDSKISPSVQKATQILMSLRKDNYDRNKIQQKLELSDEKANLDLTLGLGTHQNISLLKKSSSEINDQGKKKSSKDFLLPDTNFQENTRPTIVNNSYNVQYVKSDTKRVCNASSTTNIANLTKKQNFAPIPCIPFYDFCHQNKKNNNTFPQSNLCRNVPMPIRPNSLYQPSHFFPVSSYNCTFPHNPVSQGTHMQYNRYQVPSSFYGSIQSRRHANISYIYPPPLYPFQNNALANTQLTTNRFSTNYQIANVTAIPCSHLKSASTSINTTVKILNHSIRNIQRENKKKNRNTIKPSKLGLSSYQSTEFDLFIVSTLISSEFFKDQESQHRQAVYLSKLEESDDTLPLTIRTQSKTGKEKNRQLSNILYNFLEIRGWGNTTGDTMKEAIRSRMKYIREEIEQVLIKYPNLLTGPNPLLKGGTHEFQKLYYIYYREYKRKPGRPSNNELRLSFDLLLRWWLEENAFSPKIIPREYSSSTHNVDLELTFNRSKIEEERKRSILRRNGRFYVFEKKLYDLVESVIWTKEEVENDHVVKKEISKGTVKTDKSRKTSSVIPTKKNTETGNLVETFPHKRQCFGLRFPSSSDSHGYRNWAQSNSTLHVNQTFLPQVRNNYARDPTHNNLLAPFFNKKIIYKLAPPPYINKKKISTKHPVLEKMSVMVKATGIELSFVQKLRTLIQIHRQEGERLIHEDDNSEIQVEKSCNRNNLLMGDLLEKEQPTTKRQQSTTSISTVPSTPSSNTLLHLSTSATNSMPYLQLPSPSLSHSN